MTRAELITKMAEKSEITKAAAGRVLSAFEQSVAEELKLTGRMSLVGFGTFTVVKRKERQGRNPQTGKKIKIPAKNVIKFKVGKTLAGVV